MKDKILGYSLAGDIKEALSHFRQGPKHMNERFKKYPLWYKGVTGVTAVTLAVLAACDRNSYVPLPPNLPGETPTQPAPGDLGEIIENPTVAVEQATQRITGSLVKPSEFSLESVVNQYPELKGRRVSVFAVKINQNTFEYATTSDVDPEKSWAVISGDIVVQGQEIIADQMTLQNEKLFIKDNAGIWKELIKIRIKGQGDLPDVFAWYLYDAKPNPDGTFDLSLTKSVLAYPALSEEEWIKQTSGPTKDRPVMIMWAPWQPMYIYPRWETDYVVIPINSFENIPGGAKDTLVVSQRTQITATPESTSTPEIIAIPDLGDPRYGQEIEKLGPDRVQVTENQVLVDWEGTGKFEPAFSKNENGEWILEDFMLPRPEGWESLSTDEIKGTGTNGDVFYFRPEKGDVYIRALYTGAIRITRRIDFSTGQILPGYMVLAEGISRRLPGTPDFYFWSVAHADDGDGIDMMRPSHKPIKSIFDYKSEFDLEGHFDVSFPTKRGIIPTTWDASSWVEAAFDINILFLDNPYLQVHTILPSGFGTW